MSKIYNDSENPNLLWMEFDTPNWDNYNDLLSELESKLKTDSIVYYLIFVPLIDLPKGSPMPHMQRLLKIADKSPFIDQLIVIIPNWMIMAQTFGQMMLKITGMSDHVVFVKTHEEALKQYKKYQETL